MILALVLVAALSPLNGFRQAAVEARGCPLRNTGHVLVQSARQHSREMARAGDIFHTDPLEPRKWSRAGEVVGVGSSWSELFAAFLDSPDHRRILLDCAYQKIAVGIVRADGRVWMTARLYG